MGPAYAAITCFYVTGFLLTLGIRTGPMGGVSAVTVRLSLWRGLREGLAHLWDTPSSLAALWLAFLVNMTAYPLTSGLLPFVARDIYHTDQTGLGYLIASFAFGAVLGSVAISIAGRAIRPARMMIVFALTWYAMLLVFCAYGEPRCRLCRRFCSRVSRRAWASCRVGIVAARRRGISGTSDWNADAGDLRPADRVDGG